MYIQPVTCRLYAENCRYHFGKIATELMNLSFELTPPITAEQVLKVADGLRTLSETVLLICAQIAEMEAN